MKEVEILASYNTLTQVLTLRDKKYKTIQFMLKLEGNGSTMSRFMREPSEDVDNYWIGVKPADGVVFENNLFGRHQLVVTKFDFLLTKEGKK